MPRRCSHRAGNGLTRGRCQNGAVTSPRRDRKLGDPSPPPVAVPPPADSAAQQANSAAQQANSAAQQANSAAQQANSAAQQGRLTKQIVFFMLIGWLVIVVLVVVLISVT
jgi:hypothetical protein